MKVGDYVRTKHGYIGIYTEKEEIERVPDWNGGWKDEKILYQLINGSRFFEDKIIKSSPNIIDLIEIGDLMYIDICPDDCGGIVVPRIAETLAE
jgi:hypothetical protein